ncbi:hypothetical protein [Lentisalinibacter sediminis]|uniref:hypothetical protein n=1 Tax=Lentisalinibacter sediminis TaxID=2992237 RepID=UPI0038642360
MLPDSAGRRAALPLGGMLAALLLAGLACAGEQEHGDASFRVEYQYIRTGDFYDDSPFFVSGGDVGETDTHALLFSLDYALNERWSVFASVPYIRKRHQGTRPHDFTEFVTFDPPDRSLVDDGDFHGGFQDFTLGVEYRFAIGPAIVSPFLSYGVPTHEYPFYGKAIIGKNLWQVTAGAQLEYQPYFSDWYFGGSVAHVFSEEPLGVNVDHWLLSGSAGYFFGQRLLGRVFVVRKDSPHGLRLPGDFTDSPTYQDPSDFDTELWWQHDRVLAHSFTNVGIGIDYVVSPRLQIAGQTFRTVDADQSNEIDYAVTFAVTVGFAGE